MIRSLLKRSGIFTGVLTISKIITSLVFIWIARIVSPSDFGYIVFFLTSLYVTASVTQWGLSYYFQKNATRESTNAYLHEVYQAHTTTILISLCLLLPLFEYLHVFSRTDMFFWVIAYIAHAYTELSRGYYLKIASPYAIGLKPAIEGIPLLVGLIFFNSALNRDVIIVLGTLGFVLSSIVLVPIKHVLPALRIRFRETWNTLVKSSPFAFLIITSLAYARGDQLIVKFSLNNYALGIYGTAYRFLETIALIPHALSQNLFSITSQHKGITRKQLNHLMLIMLLSGTLLGGFVSLFSQSIISLLLGNAYLDAVVPLQIFGIVVLLFFVNAPFATHVQSSSLIQAFLPYGIANTVLNLVLNIIFVPVYGVPAAAIIMLITELSGLLINIYFSQKVFAHEQA